VARRLSSEPTDEGQEGARSRRDHREARREGGRAARVSKPVRTIHTSPAGRLAEYLETVLMICPRSLVLNGTFREFPDGFEELGIPRTGSTLPPPSLPSTTRSFYIARSFFLPFATRLENRLHKEAVCGGWRRAGDSLSLSLSLSSSPAFPVSLGVFRFPLRSSPLCYRSLRFISEPFRDAPAVHPRMGTIWRIRSSGTAAGSGGKGVSESRGRELGRGKCCSIAPRSVPRFRSMPVD